MRFCDLRLSRLLRLKSPLMQGEDVKALQTWLTDNGYDIGRFGIDGVYGDATRSAVKAFQAEYCRQTDGIVGKETIRAMGGSWQD